MKKIPYVFLPIGIFATAAKISVTAVFNTAFVQHACMPVKNMVLSSSNSNFSSFLFTSEELSTLFATSSRSPREARLPVALVWSL
jgi:hypothetical protein